MTNYLNNILLPTINKNRVQKNGIQLEVVKRQNIQKQLILILTKVNFTNNKLT